MPHSALRWSFVGFYLTLGLVVLIASALTLAHALDAGRSHLHLGILAGVETIGAVLFLLPRTVRVGGALLLVTFLGAVVAHALRGEFLGSLLVYAVGTILVMVHGSAWPLRPEPPPGAA